MPLNSSQLTTQQQIAAYGKDNGFSDDDVEIALRIAFLESSLGQNTGSPPGSTASGVFQYNNATWAGRHADIGDKNSFANQLEAIFDDISTYHTRYDTGIANGNIPSSIDFGEYVYIKHHDGSNYTDFENAPGLSLWNNSTYKPDVTSQPSAGLDSAPLGAAHLFRLLDLVSFQPTYWWADSDYVPKGVVLIGEPELDSDGS